MKVTLERPKPFLSYEARPSRAPRLMRYLPKLDYRIFRSNQDSESRNEVSVFGYSQEPNGYCSIAEYHS